MSYGFQSKLAEAILKYDTGLQILNPEKCKMRKVKINTIMPNFMKHTHKAFISALAKTGTQSRIRLNVLWNGYATISLNILSTAGGV